jgi:hypothetical protein
MNPGADLALQLLFGLLDRMTEIQTLFAIAKAQGRDVLPEEIDKLIAADDLARAQLIVAIANRRAQEKSA